MQIANKSTFLTLAFQNRSFLLLDEKNDFSQDYLDICVVMYFTYIIKQKMIVLSFMVTNQN